jgi:hypothetical protein
MTATPSGHGARDILPERLSNIVVLRLRIAVLPVGIQHQPTSGSVDIERDPR